MKGIRPRDVVIKTTAATAAASGQRLLVAGASVDFAVTAIPSRLGFTTTTAAFGSLSSTLQAAATSGDLVATLKAQSADFATATGSTVTVAPMEEITVVLPTTAPTASPTTVAVVPAVTRLTATPASPWP
jgi:hypothetical protein